MKKVPANGNLELGVMKKLTRRVVQFFVYHPFVSRHYGKMVDQNVRHNILIHTQLGLLIESKKLVLEIRINY